MMMDADNIRYWDTREKYKKPFSYSFHYVAACCYFGIDISNQINHSFPSRFTDGTPLSSTGLLSSCSLRYSLPDDYLKSKFPFCLSPCWRNNSKSNFGFSSLGRISLSRIPFSFLFLFGRSILSATFF